MNFSIRIGTGIKVDLCAICSNLAYDLNTPAGKARKDALIKNSALMKQWAKEGK